MFVYPVACEENLSGKYKAVESVFCEAGNTDITLSGEVDLDLFGHDRRTVFDTIEPGPGLGRDERLDGLSFGHPRREMHIGGSHLEDFFDFFVDSCAYVESREYFPEVLGGK